MPLIARRPAIGSTAVSRGYSGKPGFVAIDIGCFAVKVMQLDVGKSRHSLRFSRVVPHAAPLDPEDPTACLKQIGQTLERAWSVRNRWLPFPAACTLSMSLFDFRSLTLPVHPDELTSEALEEAYAADSETTPGTWEIRGWNASTHGPNQRSCSVSVIGVEKGFAAEISAKLWNCGLDCQILDGPPFALSRAVCNHYSRSLPVAILDWGFSAVTLTVAVDGYPRFTRLLRQCGLKSLIAGLMQSLGVDSDQARHLLHTYGFCAPGTNQSENNLAAVLADLARPYLIKLTEELQRSWNYLRQQPDSNLQRLVLTGGGAMLPFATESLANALPFPVDVWRLESNDVIDSSSESLSPLYASAMALARLEK